MFQSPLHRGTLFNGGERAVGEIIETSFSPLFIGALSSTQFDPEFLLDPDKFQSPLHRGTLFNWRRAS